MTFEQTMLAGAYSIQLTPIGDDRGWFARTYCRNEFSSIGHTKEWVQMNHSFTAKKGALRGLHFQLPPFEEIKLVRCVAGAVFDVIVDLRRYSATFLQWFSVELSAKNKNMIYIPAGFAHGFQTLTDDAELIYLHTAIYMPSAERGIRYNDSRLSINWPLPVTEISDRDRNHLPLNEEFTGI